MQHPALRQELYALSRLDDTDRTQHKGDVTNPLVILTFLHERGSFLSRLLRVEFRHGDKFNHKFRPFQTAPVVKYLIKIVSFLPVV